MSVLRRLYDEARQQRPFSITDLARDFPFRASKRFKGAQEARIAPSKVTKHDPVDDALVQLRSEIEQTARASQQGKVGEDLGVRQFPSSVEAPQPELQKSTQPVLVGTLLSRSEQRLQELSVEYARGDAERVDIEGTLTGTNLQVNVTAWRQGMALQMVVTLSGFTEPTFDFLRELSGYSYCDALHHVVLSEHRILFATGDVQWRVGNVQVPLKAGTNTLATLGFHPNLARLIETGTPGKKLILFGHIPEDEEADLSFFTAPFATVRAGSLRVEGAYVKIAVVTTVTRDEDGTDSFRETQVGLIGGTQVGSQRRPLFAPLPADHEMLQWRMPFEPSHPPISLPDADGLMGGNAWRSVFVERLPPPQSPTLQSYNHNTLLPVGKVTSISLGLASGSWELRYREDLRLSFHVLDFRWVVGLPDTPSTTNIFLVGEGKLKLTDGIKPVVASAFDAHVTFMPEFGVSAVAENVSQSTVLETLRALRLRGPPQGSLLDLEQPYTCTFTLNAQTTLTCIGSNGARCTWRSQ
jgi:hypothetical protein